MKVGRVGRDPPLSEEGLPDLCPSRWELEVTDLEALVVAAYVFADEYPVAARAGRPPLTTDAELVALAVAQAAIGISSDRQSLGLIGRVLPGWFPHLPEQSQYNRRLRGLVELISIVQRGWPAGSTQATISDSALIGVANYPGCAQRSEFAGFARFGYAKSQHRFVYGVRLVLLTDERGLPLGYTIVPANEKEYEPLADLLTGTPAAVVVADKGFWGRDYSKRLAAVGTTLLTPDRTRHHDNEQREHASPRLDPTPDRERLLQPERTDAARAPPPPHTRRTGRPNRATHPRAHPRHAAQHPQRPPRTRPRRL